MNYLQISKVIEEIGARDNETMSAYAARLASCPKCHAPEKSKCRTPTGRNHPERIRSAILAELKLWAQVK